MPDTVNLDTLIRGTEVLVMIGGIGYTVFKLGRAIAQFETLGQQQTREITELKDNVKRIGELVTQMAVQTSRLDSFNDRINRAEEHIDELRHGEGFVFPLPQAKPVKT